MAYDPKRIIDTADSFLLAANRSLEQRPLGPGKFQMLLVPAVVSTAFAVELYFKAIITMEGGSSKGHPLSDLFEKISPKSQSALAESVGIEPAEFGQKLIDISDVFRDWRYVFEKESKESSFGLDFPFLRKLAWASKQIAYALLNSEVNMGTGASVGAR